MNAKKLETNSRDAISCLPKEVLGNILSSLPTKEAASTSVLSTKWRNMYRFVDVLDFDDSVGAARQESCMLPESFKNFVDQTLALQCNSPIKKLSLKLHVGKDQDGEEMACVGRWISNAVERGALELHVRLTSSRVIGLPFQLFTSKTLVKLTIGKNLSLDDFPLDTSLPALKILFLESIFFDDEEFSNVFLACFPVLEELSLHQTNVNAPLTISNPTVNRLLVNYDSRDIYGSGYMSFDLPNLVYLDYSDYARENYGDVYLEALVEAKLDLYDNGHFIPNVTSLIMGIKNVEILHLSYFTLDVIYYSCCKRYPCLPVFKNLVKFSLEYCDKRGHKLLAYLIKQSPKLETLIIPDVDSYEENICIPLNKVKVLHILNHPGDSEQLESFLRGFEFLEVVQVKGVMKKDWKSQRFLEFHFKCQNQSHTNHLFYSC